jgi:hypothetical protein
MPLRLPSVRVAPALQTDGEAGNHRARPCVSRQGYDDLQARGLAERRPDPDDRRARTIFLTEQGEQTLKRVRRLATDQQREFFAALNAEERRELHVLLRKLADAAT